MKTWFTADQHFYHSNILKFTKNNGELLRPNFSNIEEMNEYMIEKWNSVVAVDDKIYHLGDIVMPTSATKMSIIKRLNGRKVLIKGNHDKAKLSIYAQHFTDIRSEAHLKTPDNDMVIFTHRPIYLGNDLKFNIHGHLHQKLIQDYRYLNLCVEWWDYTPVSWDQIVEQVVERKTIIEEEKSL